MEYGDRDERGIILEEDAGDQAPASEREVRMDALMNERLSGAGRREMERLVERQDAESGTASADFDEAALRRKLRFRGEVPDKLQKLLSQWIPALMAQADARGLRLNHQDTHIAVLSRPAYEAEQGALPAGLRLPASSYTHDPSNRRYTVQVVLPEQVGTLDGLFTVLRALLSRLYGDVYLREEILPREPYREDAEHAAGEVTVGLSEQVQVLAQAPHTTAELEEALTAYGRVIGVEHRRHPEQTRKAYFQHLQDELEHRRVDAGREAVVNAAFSHYLTELRRDLPAALQQMLDDMQALNRQVGFLPPDEQPEQDRLRAQNPVHYLRSAKLRMEFMQEAYGAVVEDFDSLEATDGRGTPLAEQRVAGHLSHLETHHLARPYLMDGVQLSDELRQQRTAFPLEVHALMQRLPPTDTPDKQFAALKRKLENSAYQRLYSALLLERHWLRLGATGRAGDFRASEMYKQLKGLAANFRFRLPLLQSLFVRAGVVLELAEAEGGGFGKQPGTAPARNRLPPDTLARGWGQYAAHALLAGAVEAGAAGKGVDAAQYEHGVEARLSKQAKAGSAPARLTLLFRAIDKAALHHAAAAEQGAEGTRADGLPLLVHLLEQCPGTFRFAMTNALTPPPAHSRDGASTSERLAESARSVLQAWAHSRANAIVVGE